MGDDTESMHDIDPARAAFMAREDEVRLMSEDGELTCRLYLVRNHVPFDVAFSLDTQEARAWNLIFARMDGHEWDWSSNDWKKRE